MAAATWDHTSIEQGTEQINIIRGDSDGFRTDRTMHMHVRRISFLIISRQKQHGKQGPFLILATYELCTCIKDMPAMTETREKYDSAHRSCREFTWTKLTNEAKVRCTQR
jgi:hypothetical protein